MLMAKKKIKNIVKNKELKWQHSFETEIQIVKKARSHELQMYGFTWNKWH